MTFEYDGKMRREILETAEGLAYLTYLYRDLRLTDKEAAKRLKITPRTLYNWRRDSKKINGAVEGGKRITDTMVENALLKSAIGGNVTAMIFWLKNRKPESWRENVVQENKDNKSEKISFVFDRSSNEH